MRNKRRAFVEDIGFRNRTLGLSLTYLWAMHFSIAFTTVFYQDEGLSFWEIFVILAAVGVMSAVTEVASGLSADRRFGAKIVMLAGLAVQTVQSYLFAISTTFNQFLGSMLLNSIAWSMTSGTVNTIVQATSTKEETKRFNFHVPIAQGLGAISGVLIGWSILLTSGQISMSFLFQPLTFIVGFVIALGFDDPTSRHKSDKSRKSSGSNRTFGEVCTILFRQEARIRWLLLFGAISSNAALALLWLIQPSLEANGLHVEHFAVVYLCQTAISAILSLCNKRIYDKIGGQSTQLLLLGTIGGAGIAAGLPIGLIGTLTLFVAIAADRAFTQTLVTNAINSVKQLKNDLTTAQSIYSALKALVGISIPGVGWLASHFSVSVALPIVGVVAYSLGGVFLWAHHRSNP